MNYYKVGMNYELHMVYIPYHNNEKGICMNLLLVEDDLNLGKILKRQMEDHGITVTVYNRKAGYGAHIFRCGHRHHGA